MKNIFSYIFNKLKLRINGEMKHNLKNAYTKNRQYKSKLSSVIFQYYLNQYFLGGIGEERGKKLIDKTVDIYIKDDVYDFGFLKIPLEVVKPMKDVFISECIDLIHPYLYEDYPLLNEGTYEQHGISVEKDDIVIDAGANIGIFSLFAVSKGALVYAFEPIDKISEVLEKSKALNAYTEEIKIIKKGLSDITGSGEIFIGDIDNNSSIVLKGQNEATQTISLISLDDFVRENNITKIDFIKADIEGAERLLLKGAQKTLKTLKPKLAICTYHLPDDKDVLTKLILDANPDYEIFYSAKKLFAR